MCRRRIDRILVASLAAFQIVAAVSIPGAKELADKPHVQFANKTKISAGTDLSRSGRRPLRVAARVDTFVLATFSFDEFGVPSTQGWTTHDRTAQLDTFFHVASGPSEQGVQVKVDELKAVFFVKSFEGDRGHQDLHEGDRAGYGKKIRVVFQDGEEIVGYTSGYSAERPAFFVFPVDPESNNDRVLVVNGATAKVEFI